MFSCSYQLTENYNSQAWSVAVRFLGLHWVRVMGLISSCQVSWSTLGESDGSDQ